MQSTSASRTIRSSGATAFIPAPIAPITPSSRSAASAGSADAIASSRWSSGSWTWTTSARSRPSRARLSSSERRTPSAPKSKRRSSPESSANIDAGGRRPGLHQHAADLRGEHELLAWALAQRRAEAQLGDAGAVVRRGVERANAAPPGLVDGRARARLADRLVEPAERGAAECEARDPHPARAELALLDHRQAAPSDVGNRTSEVSGAVMVVDSGSPPGAGQKRRVFGSRLPGCPRFTQAAPANLLFIPRLPTGLVGNRFPWSAPA